ncbi:MAG TPA: hypothetical protein VFM90_09820, partial [Cyclobacteriaceae bacterium]|nr:hypothetical protein [Cyclobacteriaceae bacterium]
GKQKSGLQETETFFPHGETRPKQFAGRRESLIFFSTGCNLKKPLLPSPPGAIINNDSGEICRIKVYTFVVMVRSKAL